MTEPTPEIGGRPGCVRGTLGVAVLAVLSPLVVLVRIVRRWRRGDEIRVIRTAGPFPTDGGEPMARVDVEIDVPAHRAAAERERITDVVVRVAERLCAVGDVYHVIYRIAELPETVAMPVGPQLQELGDRFALVLGQRSMAGRTVVWLTLPHGLSMAELLDPTRYDPEAPGEPEALLATAPMRWAMTTDHVEAGPSVVHRLLLYVPSKRRSDVEKVLTRLES